MSCSGEGRPSRRATLAGSAAFFSGCVPPARSPASPVSILRAGYDATLQDAATRILAMHRLDVRGKNVLLKPNLVEFEEGSPINTSPALVYAVLEACRAAGAGSVRIAEGPGHRRATLELAEAAGYFESIPRFEELFTDLNLDDVEQVPLRRPHSKLDSLYLPKTALGADLIISLPRMKTHHWVGATLSMKNLFGLVPGAVYGWPKNVLHWAGIDACIADIYKLFPRSFAIIDAIDCMEGNGPIQGTRKHLGLLVAGNDLAAADATGCRIMGLDPQRIEYLRMAGAPDNIVQIGETVRNVHTPFEVIPECRRFLLQDS